MREETRTLALTPVEAGALAALVGLAVGVMQSDRATVEMYGEVLSQPGVEGICRRIVEQVAALHTPESDANAH